jgi:uncharacterized membrane protein
MASAPTPPPATSAGMQNNVAGALAYLVGIITGIIFVVIEPYNKIRFVRFHAFQSIFFSVACIVISIVLGIVSGVMLSVGGWGMWSVLSWLFLLVRLAMFLVWLLLMYKAYNNEEYKLPIIGDLAAKQAGA